MRGGGYCGDGEGGWQQRAELHVLMRRARVYAMSYTSRNSFEATPILPYPIESSTCGK